MWNNYRLCLSLLTTVGVCVMAEVRSDVWTYFEKEDTNPKSRLCQKLYAYCGGTPRAT